MNIVPSKRKIDWMGRWYTVAKERGVNVIATLARGNSETDKMEFFNFSHENYDGAGALGDWLRSRGYHMPELPKGREGDRPSLFKAPGIIWKGLHNLKSRIIPWKESNDAGNPPPEALKYFLLEEDETEKLNQKCKSQKLSQNSYLLSVIHNLLVPELTSGECVGGWVFPVNMRGNISQKDDTMNGSSGILVELGRTAKASEIHRKIKEQLLNKFHWSNWWVYQIGPIVRLAGMRYLSRRSAEKSFFFGTFSNMGPWPMEGSEPENCYDKNEFYICAPPGTYNYPISVGVMTWHGRLSLTLKIHPHILKDQSLIESYLKKIESEVKEYLNS